MSVCDEGWNNHKRRCPVIDWVDNGICDVTKSFLAFNEVDTCAFAPILKLLVEAKEVGNTIVIDHDPKTLLGDWDAHVEFWIRR
ncbi:MAG: hypothetical protein JRE40_10320 [Deltaproteobacteria bacterium]|nr:hypothetical protein [Deltaproteobacteria bacterium]MBW2673934.1 hypothetical protein [Deltaproteobacteria bacterium]